MTIHSTELAKAFDDLWAKSSERNWILARLGQRTDSSTLIDVAGRSGYVYVSLGANGEGGSAIALDAIGVAKTAWTLLRLRRERGQLVIREAPGGSGSVSSFFDLSDVEASGWDDGDIPQWSASAGKLVPVVPAGGGGGAPSPHDLSGPHHSGLLAWGDLSKAGSALGDLANRQHASLTGVGPNDHHNQVHVLASDSGLGDDHTIVNGVDGYVLRASGVNTAAIAQLQHDDLGGITPDQHHKRVHNIITGDDDGATHTIVGSAFDLVGAVGTNVLGLLTPSSNPGASAKILRTDASGNFAFDTNLLYVDAANNRVRVNRDAPGLGESAAALDVMAANNADHTVRIKQKVGQVNRLWRVENSAGQELIVLDPVGNLQSGNPGFVSGLTGWQMTPTGTLEANNGWFRGELHATVFVKDEVHIGGGTTLFATGARLYSDAVIDATTTDTETVEVTTTVPGFGQYMEVTTTAPGFGQYLEFRGIRNYIEIEDSPTGPGFYFSRGETIRSKTEVATGITDFWLTVNNGKQLDGYQRYSVYKQSGTDGKLPAGAGIGSWGFEGDGRVLITSDLNYAPYLDVFTIGPEVWTGNAGSTIPHVRLGQLMGVGVTGVSGISQFGIIAGTDLSNANSPYAILSNKQLRLHKVPYTANNGTSDTVLITADGDMKVGTNIEQLPTTSFQVITTGPNAGDVLIGGVTSIPPAPGDTNFVHWDKSENRMRVSGDLIIEGSSYLTEDDLATSPTITGLQSGVTSAQNTADTAQNTADTAQGAANAAQQTAIDLNSYRAIGVDGTFTPVNPSTSAVDSDTIWWTGASVRKANGTTITISNGNTGNMAARTWLYILHDATSPATMQTQTNIALIPANAIIVGVAALGVNAASITLLPGRTLITGDQILTGTIVAGNIKSGAITADKIWVDSSVNLSVTGSINGGSKTYGSTAPGWFLGWDISGGLGAHKFDVGRDDKYLRFDGLDVRIGGSLITGDVQVQTTGYIRSGTKTWGSSTPGFFLGYNSGNYVFDVGNADNHIRWSGSTLQIRSNDELWVSRSTNSAIMRFVTPAGSSQISHGQGAGGSGTTRVTINSNDVAMNDTYMGLPIAINDAIRIEKTKTPTPTGVGTKGDICWDLSYIYVCIATNTWRRVALSAF